MTRSLPASLARLRAVRDAGLCSEAVLWAEVTTLVRAAIDRHDPDALRVVHEAVAREPLRPASVAALADLAQSNGGASRRWPEWSAVADEVADLLVTRVAAAAATVEPGAAAALVAAVPADLCGPELLRRAAALDLPEDDRCRLDRHLLPAALRHVGPASFDTLVRPHLGVGSPVAAGLLADAYLQDGFGAEHRALVIEHLAARAGACPTQALLPVVVRLSVERADQRALPLARHLSGRADLPASAPPVLGLVLWLGGARDEGRRVARIEPSRPDEFGWATQASRAVAAFLRTWDAGPEHVLAECAAGPGTESPGRPVAAVGALVGRLALSRMRAYLALGDRAWAAREAAL